MALTPEQAAQLEALRALENAPDTDAGEDAVETIADAASETAEGVGAAVADTVGDVAETVAVTVADAVSDAHEGEAQRLAEELREANYRLESERARADMLASRVAEFEAADDLAALAGDADGGDDSVTVEEGAAAVVVDAAPGSEVTVEDAAPEAKPHPYFRPLRSKRGDA